MSDNTLEQSNLIGWHFDNSYTRLPGAFYAPQNPTPVREPRLAIFNHALAESLGLNTDLLLKEAVTLFSGNQIPEGAEPLAQAYAGHQYGYFTMLGDGRAILLAEQLTPAGDRFDIQLKGAGQTPYSRRGDGRAALGPMLREYIISEAMHALGIPTTRSLAVVATGETVRREIPLSGAILTRIASSHIRVGTFQYAASSVDDAALKTLADYTLNRHYPECAESSTPYLDFLNAVMERQAMLLAKWQLVGFIHGVMNTDNMALCGETIDYGPCAFMDTYDPATVFSSIDHHGRYAYSNQPLIAQWNLARFTETLLPLLDSDPEKSLTLAQAALEAFPERFKHHWLFGMRAKLGLVSQASGDEALIQNLLTCMHQHRADYTNTFRALSLARLPEEPFFQTAEFTAWHAQWQARLTEQPESRDAVLASMRTQNPSVIPRNHRVEEALTAAVEQSDFTSFHKLLSVLQTPYTDLPENSDYHLPPPQGLPYQTFCGT